MRSRLEEVNLNLEELLTGELIQEKHFMFEVDPEKAFPSGTFERFIVDTMKNIDIAKFSILEGLDKGGPDKINPKSLLGIIFYGYADGVFSSYKLSTSEIFLSNSSILLNNFKV